MRAVTVLQTPATHRSGFTLVEAMVALALFALVTTAGAAVLSMSIDNRLAVRAASERTAALHRTRSLLKADLGQVVTRRTRDRNGEPQALPLTGSTAPGEPVLVLTRAGWTNPGDAARSSLQRVEYRLEAGRLERRVSPFLDGSRPGAPQLLLTGVSDLSVDFLQDGQAGPVPLPRLTGEPPDAVRLTFTLESHGRMTQLFLIGGGR